MDTATRTLYRVIEMTVQPPGLLPTRRTLWLGDDLDQLAEAYPEHQLHRDDLDEVHTGSVIRFIEQLLGDRWIICEYPVNGAMLNDLVATPECNHAPDRDCNICYPFLDFEQNLCVECRDPLLGNEQGDTCSFCMKNFARCGLCSDLHTDPVKMHLELCACCDAGKGRPTIELRWGHFDPDLPHRGSRRISQHMVGARTFRR